MIFDANSLENYRFGVIDVAGSLVPASRFDSETGEIYQACRTKGFNEAAAFLLGQTSWKSDTAVSSDGEVCVLRGMLRGAVALNLKDRRVYGPGLLIREADQLPTAQRKAVEKMLAELGPAKK